MAASAPVRVAEAGSFLERMGVPADADPVVLGFDFPIGVPEAYARRAGITHFPTFLRQAGKGAWATFFEVADAPDEISLQRPFYPRSGLPKGSKLRAQLEQALGVSWAELLRRCERAQSDRREACSLFWTLGGNQVGKGALAGWRLLQAAPTAAVSFWPFDGPLDSLLQPGRVVVTETYPAESAHHIDVGRVLGKQHQLVRRSHAPALLGFAERAGIAVDEALRASIEDGFGSSSSGEDPFDAVIGLFGMINVLAGGRAANDPPDDAVRTVEGWILGQAPRAPGTSDAEGDPSPSMLLSTGGPVAEPYDPDQHAGLGPPQSANLEPPPKLGSLWTTVSVDAGWLKQVVVLVEHAIDQLVLEFVALPYLHRVEHSLHCELYSLLTANRTLGRPYQMAEGAWTQLVHKEWPETIARPAKAGRGGNFDMVVLDPLALRQATIAEFQDGLVKPAIVIEIGLNYGAQHLRDDVNKLTNSAIDHSYIVHLSRNPVHHHPDLVEGLHQPSVQIAAALAGTPSPTYRLLQRQP